MPVILALRKPKQGDHELKASLFQIKEVHKNLHSDIIPNSPRSKQIPVSVTNFSSLQVFALRATQNKV